MNKRLTIVLAALALGSLCGGSVRAANFISPSGNGYWSGSVSPPGNGDWSDSVSPSGNGDSARAGGSPLANGDSLASVLISRSGAGDSAGVAPAGDHFVVGSAGDSLGHVTPTRYAVGAGEGIVVWDASLYGTGSSNARLPFWAQTNRRGLFPASLGLSSPSIENGGPFTFSGVMTGGVGLSYMTRSGITLDGGLSLAGYGAPGDWNAILDRLYFGIGWKKFHLDIGLRDRDYDFAGLSLTNGSVDYSGNARNLPGYNLYTDYIWLPFRKKVIALKANFADYGLWDNRDVTHTLVHNEALFMKIRPARRFEIVLGVDMWAQWAGYSARYGEQPDGFTDYLRVLVGAPGGSDALGSDQLNVLGNLLGRELIRFDWHADRFTLTFQHDHLFDDKSGMRFWNFPDGVYTLALSSRDRSGWVTDVLYEFIHTLDQSGPLHDRPATDEEKAENPGLNNVILGGEDNYFNNGVYRSGWTYYGNVIGLPLALPMYAGEDGIVMGIASNKIIGHHFGIRGNIARTVPYRFLFTWSRQEGRTRTNQEQSYRFESRPEMYSIALETEFPLSRSPRPARPAGSASRPTRPSSGSADASTSSAASRGFDDAADVAHPGSRSRSARSLNSTLGIGFYADFGKIYPNSFGITIRLSIFGSSRFTSSRPSTSRSDSSSPNPGISNSGSSRPSSDFGDK